MNWVALKAALVHDRFCNGRTPEEYKKSALGSHLNVFAYDEDLIVGNGRILSDGVCNAYLVDIWTAESHRRRGIGSEIVRLLCESVTGQHVYLQTGDYQEFYLRSSFAIQESGMGKVVGSWLNRFG